MNKKLAWWFDDKVNVAEFEADSGIEEGDADSAVTGLDDDSGIWEFRLDSDLDVYSGIAVADKDSGKVDVDSEIVELGIR